MIPPLARSIILTDVGTIAYTAEGAAYDGTAGSTPRVTLGPLALSGVLRVGTASNGSITGATDGSTITESVAGFAVNSGQRTYTYDGSGNAGTIANALVETHPNATNSGRGSDITIAAAVPTPTVTLSAATSSANEGAAGATLAWVYTVTRSTGSGAVSVPWTFGAGTTDAADWSGGTLPAGGTVTFAAGETTKTFSVTSSGDASVEGDESFTVAIGVPSGYAAGATMSATGTMLNDDAAPTPTVMLSAATSSANEGATGTTLAWVYTVTRSTGSGAVSVPWTFTAGTTDAADWSGGTLPAGGNVSFAAGETAKTFSVISSGDGSVESNETFTVAIGAPSGYAAGATMSATGTILNDDTLVPASFTTTQLATPNRVYQRDSETGGLGSGLGRVTHQVNVTSAGAIYVRTRDKATDAIVQPSKLVASSVATGAQTLQLDLPARLGQQLVDLSGDGTAWTAGTTPISVGEVLFVWGQSLVEFALRRNGGDTLATLGVGTGNTYAYATIATGETAAWGPVADGQTNDGAAIAEFGARRAAAIGCDVGVVGHAASGQAIVEFRASTANGAKMIANAQGSGGKWAATLIIHGHSDIRYAPPIAAYKRSVKAIQARLETENSFAGTRRVMMMTTPSNNNGFWGRPINNNRIRRAGVELAAENAGWISVTAPDTETRDGVHESQRGGVAMGQAAARALSSNATGPAPVSAVRTAAQTVRVTFDKPVLGTGSWWENAKVYSRGSLLNIWPVSGGAINGAHVTLNLANDPGPGQALDVWFGLPQDGTNGPQSRMLRDGTSDLGIAAGRPYVPNVSAIVAAAIANGGAVNVPPGGNQPGVANYDLTMTNPVYSAELLAGFGPVLSGGRGTATGPGGTSLTQEIFFRVPPTSSSFQIISTWPGNFIAIRSDKLVIGYEAINGYPQFEGTTTLVPGQICHVAVTVDIDNGVAAYLARNLTGTVVVTREVFDQTKPQATVYAGDLNIRHNQGGNFPFNDSVWHHALWDGARYTSLADYTSRRPTAPYAGTEAGLLALHRLNSSGADLVLDRVTP